MSKLTRSELETTHEFQILTPKQKMFVATYVQTGIDTGKYDAVAAVNSAYKCKTEESARIMGYALLSNINIIRVLDRHFGKEPVDSFTDMLERALRNGTITVAQVQAAKMICELKGYATSLNKAPEVPEPPEHAKKPRKAKPKPAVVDDGSDVYDLKDFGQNETL